MRFEIGREYRRRDLHREYGGQQQGGIITPRQGSIILLVTGRSGRANGYLDEWLDRGTMLRYFGEGRKGDMVFTKGNKAIRDHAADGRELHLFENVRKGMLIYKGEMVCSGFEYVEGSLDADGVPRRAIAFLLTRIEVADDPDVNKRDVDDLDEVPLERLRAIARSPVDRAATPMEARRWVHRRSRALRKYVLGRAGGSCEGCGSVAPFKGTDGQPFLEAHHTRRLSDGGPDDPCFVTALCPNCHRRAHYAVDARPFNQMLIERLAVLEQHSV
jgi:5-methylcytosine-specific restriction protein A